MSLPSDVSFVCLRIVIRLLQDYYTVAHKGHPYCSIYLHISCHPPHATILVARELLFNSIGKKKKYQ